MMRGSGFIFKNFPVWAAWSVLLWTSISCDTCDDCHGVNRDPRVKIKFIAAGTMERTRDSLDSINQSLQIVRDSLETETDPDKIDSLIRVEESLQEDSAKFAGWEDLFTRGYTHMDLIEGVGAENYYADTVIRDFALPINMHADSSVYHFVYHDLTDTMEFKYYRDIVQTLDGVRMKIIELEVVQEMTTFDSVHVRCGDDICSNWEMNIEVYF